MLKRNRSAIYRLAHCIWGLPLIAAVLALLVLFCGAGAEYAAQDSAAVKQCASGPVAAPSPILFTEQDIAALFDERCFYQTAVPSSITKTTRHGEITAFTTIQPQLQEQMISLFKRYAPLIAAGVVLDAQTGAVLAMANYTKGNAGRVLLPDGEENYCLYAGFPAASLIKIITAAAAIEKKGFTQTQTLPVAGRYHTLYRSQLGLGKGRYRSEQVPLDKAFALSINPFFGKLGISYLSDAEFAQIAEGFLFNAPIDFDLALPQSRIVQPLDDFERAEVASGYNTRTVISPLHAALIASLPANDGKIMRPYIIDRIVAADGRELYGKQIKVISQPLSRSSVEHLHTLMQGTVRKGTARSSFAHLRSRAGSKDWITGGKTGSIDLPDHRGRCDWFAGFGEDGTSRIAVACILIHGANRVVRSAYVASQAISACLEPGVTVARPAHTTPQPQYRAAGKAAQHVRKNSQHSAKLAGKRTKKKISKQPTKTWDTANGG